MRLRRRGDGFLVFFLSKKMGLALVFWVRVALCLDWMIPPMVFLPASLLGGKGVFDILLFMIGVQSCWIRNWLMQSVDSI